MMMSRNFHSLKVTKQEMMNEDTHLHKIKVGFLSSDSRAV